MSDESVIVRNQGTIFLGGPPLVKAATGEEISAEDLGGGDLHAKKSGVVDHLAENDEHALTIVRDIVSTLQPEAGAGLELREPRPPLYDAEELYGIIPEDVRAPYDVHEIIARIVDGIRVPRVQAALRLDARLRLRAHLGHAGRDPRQQRRPVQRKRGRRARISSSSPASAARPCCSCRTSRGFMVGGKYEAEGIAKHGAKLVTAVATASVPKITVLIGGSFGAGNYGMAGRAYSPRFLFTWPNSRISVMGGEQAASVLATVHRDADKWTPEQAEAFKQPIRDDYEAQGNPWHATARLWDDGIIDPAQTRDVLGLAFAATLNAPIPERPQFGVFRM